MSKRVSGTEPLALERPMVRITYAPDGSVQFIEAVPSGEELLNQARAEIEASGPRLLANRMTERKDMTMDEVRVEALRLASVSGGTVDEIIGKAEAFYRFLTSQKPRE